MLRVCHHRQRATCADPNSPPPPLSRLGQEFVDGHTDELHRFTGMRVRAQAYKQTNSAQETGLASAGVPYKVPSSSHS